jgi:4'-phosphopantetheinyl transferase
MNCLWPAADPGDKLQEKEIHIWCANLEPVAEQLAKLQATLSDSEAKRADRFRFWRHRRRYITGRGILRELLGRYLEEHPADIEFSYSEFGKPFLADNNIHFNLSHSKETALFAFCFSADIGIDLEKIRPISDAEGIAERFFAPTEFARFQVLPEEQKDEAFFACWTRKEAFIKAVGDGLSYPLSAFDVCFAPGREAKLNTIRGSKEEAARWSLFALSPVNGFTAATAVKGRRWVLACRQFEMTN